MTGVRNISTYWQYQFVIQYSHIHIFHFFEDIVLSVLVSYGLCLPMLSLIATEFKHIDLLHDLLHEYFDFIGINFLQNNSFFSLCSLYGVGDIDRKEVFPGAEFT
jgi:hypothetical protein